VLDLKPGVDLYATGVREIIERGCRSGDFRTASPQLAAYAVLELGNGAKSWFRTGGRYTDDYVAREYGEFALRVVGGPVLTGPVLTGPANAR
jgi:Tetracyclin repressor-like, C-terminal domain